ncbi:YdiU family protein [Sphingosinicella sp. BN140058]|uniref:protein adenylyltransferase SelO n=1 Tax=Sphingosinicella sp. BN140058 TaxID=1892855 RepID=UPI0010121B20|nr:YdiU family protein [Sphingosinicella sp. BN140058]QAY78578.1 YdiU family protein [Sphingosinicella sp. BN140058]
MTISIPFDNSYARLPDRFYAPVRPSAASAPQLLQLNRALAAELGLDAEALAAPEGIEILSGLRIAEGSQPIAMAYAGHQFAHFVPQLGDGRAILLGEVVDRSGRRRDLQLKGSGRTPFSRGGDGKAALGPVLREYVVSEAMAALGIPTTRALAAVTTGEQVVREDLLPGAAIVRVAASHIRVGTFQFFAAREDVEGLRLLADHVIARHYPAAAQAERPYRALLDGVIAAQADLIARWLLVGFIHGVMNTDNMAVSGETIDYGPCAFLDDYDPNKVFSSIDRMGRYAYGRQPEMALWNLTRLAETLLPLLAEDEVEAIADAEAALAAFAPAFERAYLGGLRRKLGLFTEKEDDLGLATALLRILAANRIDFTNFFRGLVDADQSGLRDMFEAPTVIDDWLAQWKARLADEPQDELARRTLMRAANPAFIPRNHRIEAMIRAAVDHGDFAPFEELLTVLARPYEDQPEYDGYRSPPAEQERVTATFCGT